MSWTPEVGIFVAKDPKKPYLVTYAITDLRSFVATCKAHNEVGLFLPDHIYETVFQATRVVGEMYRHTNVNHVWFVHEGKTYVARRWEQRHK